MTMPGSGVAAAAFAAGCLLQLLYLTWRHWTKKHVLIVLVVAPLGWAFATAQLEDPVTAAFSVAMGAVMAFALFFRATITPKAGEHTLFLSALPMWALLAEADWSNAGVRFLATIHAAATIATLILVATTWNPPRGLRIVASAYGALQLVFLFGWQFNWGALSFFFDGAPPPTLEALASGLLFALVVAYASPLYAIVRPPATETAERDTPEARQQHLDLLASRYQDKHLTPTHAVTLALLFLAYWGMSRAWLQLDSMILIWPWLALTPLLPSRLNPGPTPTMA